MIRVICKPVLPLLRVIKHRSRLTGEVRSLPRANGRRFILLGAPTHGNLGDHAIALAQHLYLRDKFPDTPAAELTEEALIYASARSLKKAVRPDDILILRGGGDMGTIWGADRTRYRMLKIFPKNKTVFFPQSVFFEDTPRGRKAARISERKYGGHACLHMTARDEISYEYMKKRYPKVTLTPDIVLYLNKQEPRQTRQGALLAFRKDAERRLPEDEKSALESMLAPYTKSIRFTDTVLPRRVSPDGRESALEAKLDEFRKAKVVMTDRLHGMVFSAITATPCIAFPNSYHKMEGLYRWLRELPYIRFARGLSEVPAHLEELWAMNGTEYDPAPFRDLFAPLDRLLTPPS